MTMNRGGAAVADFAPEVSQADLFAAIRAEGQTVSGDAAAAEAGIPLEGDGSANQQQATQAVDDLDAKITALLDTKLAEQLGPLRARFEAIETGVARALNKGDDVSPKLLAQIEKLGKDIRDLKLDNIYDPTERENFLKAEQEAAQRAKDEAEAAQKKLDDDQRNEVAQKAAYETQVQTTNQEFFNGPLMKFLMEAAAEVGKNPVEAKDEAEKFLVYPKTNERGWLMGYDWDRFTKELTDKWSGEADRRTEGRRTARTAGSGNRPAQGAPARFDAWDPKYHEKGGSSVGDMVLDAIRTSGF